MKIIEALKEENKELQENTSKQMKELNKSFKDLQENGVKKK